MEDHAITILFAAGGTGGHLFPALALADEVRVLLPDAKILFVGTRKKIEARVVPARGYAFHTIWISGLHRSFQSNNVLFPVKVVVAFMQSFFLIRRCQPDVVIGTGGYVAGPVLLAAALLGIPTVVHESNSYPGVTTRLLSRRVTKMFITYEVTKRWLKRQDNVELVGTPTRKELGSIRREEAAQFFGFDPKKKTVLVFGGSLGSASLNRAMARIAEDLIHAGIQIIWQTGDQKYRVPFHDGVKRQLWIGAFIDNMEYAYAAADLVLCRAGATTLAELTRLGKPAILVPYPLAAANHQMFNARTLADAGAAEIILDREIEAKAEEAIVRLLSDEAAHKQMRTQSLTLGRPEAGRDIAKKIVQLGGK